MEVDLLEYLRRPDTPVGVLDAVYAGWLLYGLVRGAFRGLPGELAGLLGTVVTFIGAWKFYVPVSAFIRAHTRLEHPAGSDVLAYVLMVILFLASWKLITWLLHKALDWTCPRGLRIPGGMLLGVAKSAVVLCLLLMAVELSGHEYLKEQMIRQSWFGRQTREVIPTYLHDRLPALFPADETAPEDDGPGNA